MRRLPNLIYIGPDKAGSSWLFRLFSQHPDVFVTPAKDVYFFDKYYHLGTAWYQRQFAGAKRQRIVADISHDYLYSRPAAARIHEVLPDARLMVCLREPCDRTFSSYLHLLKSGIFTGTFDEALAAHPGMLQRSLYGKWIARYLKYVPRHRLVCSVFDDLRQDAQSFADKLFRDLGVGSISLPPQLKKNVLPASRSRSIMLTRVVKTVADVVRDAGLPGIVGRIKGSGLVQKALYASYVPHDRPQPEQQTWARLRHLFRSDVELLDQELGTSLGELWGYDRVATNAPAARRIAPRDDFESTSVGSGRDLLSR